MRTGRPSDSNSAKELRGSKYAKPPVEIRPVELRMPKLSERAQEHWNRIVPVLQKAGRLREEDETALALLCKALDKTEMATDEEARLWQKHSMELLSHFGMNPMSRIKGGFPSEAKKTEPESRQR